MGAGNVAASTSLDPQAANDAPAAEATGEGPPGRTQGHEQGPSQGQEGDATPQEGLEGSQASHPAKPQKARQQSPPSSGVECVFLHGSLESLRCFRCRRVCEWEGGREAQTLTGHQPECPHCAGATAAREERGKRALGVGKLRPDIVLYGEEHPDAHLISPVVTHDLGLGPDLMLILGTSLKVHGLKVLVRQFAKAVHSRGGKVVFVNFTRPSESSWGDVIDYWVAWDCDAWVGDLREKVPALWLPPGAVEEKKKGGGKKEKKGEKGEKGAEKSAEKSSESKSSERAGEQKSAEKKSGKANGAHGKRKSTAAEKKSAANAKNNSKPGAVETATTKPAVHAFEEVTTSTAADTHTEPVSHPHLQTSNPPRPEPPRDKGRVVLREDKVNGAYFTWKIMESLRGISGREAPPAMELPTVRAARAIAAEENKVAKREWKRRRRSAAAAEERGEAMQVQVRMPEVWSIHSSAPGVYGPHKGSGEVERGPLPSGHHAPEQSGAVLSTQRESLPAEASHASTSTHRHDHWGQLAPSTPVQPHHNREAAHAQPQPYTLAELRPIEQPPAQQPAVPAQSSILTAVKSNPRKRKRKTINGEEVVLPAVGSRAKVTPSHSEKENAGGAQAKPRIPSLSAQPMDGAIRLPPLRGLAVGAWKLDAMEPVSPPEGPAVRFERGGGWGNPFYYEDSLVGLGRGGEMGGEMGVGGGEGEVDVDGVVRRGEREMEAARALFGMR